MTFTEAENAYLASQRLGRRPHRPRRQAPGHAGRLVLRPQAGHDRRDRLHHGHEPEVPQRRVKGPGVGTITFGEPLTDRAGFRLDSGLVFETDDAAREQIRQGVQQWISAWRTVTTSTSPSSGHAAPHGGAPGRGPAARAAAADRFFLTYVQRQVFDPVGVTDARCAPVRDAMPMYPPPGAGTARATRPR